MDNEWTSETLRNDGLYINKLATEFWAIRHPNGVEVRRCPCCDAKFETLRAAKLVADQAWPAKD